MPMQFGTWFWILQVLVFFTISVLLIGFKLIFLQLGVVPGIESGDLENLELAKCEGQ